MKKEVDEKEVVVEIKGGDVLIIPHMIFFSRSGFLKHVDFNGYTFCSS